MNFFAYVTNPEGYLSPHDYDREAAISVINHGGMEDHGWILLKEFEVDIDFDVDEAVRQKALELIDKAEQLEIAEHEVKMNRIIERRQRLLAISYQPVGDT